MNEISKSQLGWQICRAFLIWLALFIGIVVAMPLISLAMHVPGKLVDMQMPRLLIFAAAGASLWFPFVGLALFIRWLNCWRNFRRALVGAAILATLITVFYAEENWRGKRAWENCKRELEAKGAVLDWNKYIPPPVPDDQNFFTYSTNILLRFHKSQTDAQSEAATKLQWLRLSPFGSNSFPIFDSAKSQPPVVANLIILPTASDGRESGTNNLVVTLNAATAPEQVRNLIQTTLGRSGNGAAGFKFSEFQFSNLAPARIVLRTDTPPSVLNTIRAGARLLN